MAVKSTAKLRYPEVLLPSSSFSRQETDHTCIDCDACRWMAPQVFKRIGEMSAVVLKQPTSGEERLKALQGVHHCGYHSEKSYGAASFLIVRPEGNIIIDRDDVAEHRKWPERLNRDRILHSEDVDNSTADVETKLQGSGSWKPGKDVQLIHTPGHTECLYLMVDAGISLLILQATEDILHWDHLLMTETGLNICERYNKCSVTMRLDGVLKLLGLDNTRLVH
ncbi:hypothetical protein Peur_042917 [Populus x canadensis]